MIKITLKNGQEIITDKILWVAETVITASKLTDEKEVRELLNNGNIIENIEDELYHDWGNYEDYTDVMPAPYRELSYIKVNNRIIDIEEIADIEIIDG